MCTVRLPLAVPFGVPLVIGLVEKISKLLSTAAVTGTEEGGAAVGVDRGLKSSSNIKPSNFVPTSANG